MRLCSSLGSRAMRAVALAAVGLAAAVISSATAQAQLPSALYTWDNTGNAAPNVEAWAKNFGANTVTLNNSILGELTIIESGGAGGDVAISDGANRVRESSTAAGGGTDVSGLDFMEFDLGHNGSGPINVQFFVQASTGFNFVALGPDLAVTPGVNTYQVPLTGLTADQAVYLRTIGFSARAHAGVGDVTWTLREVRAGGIPNTVRDLATFNPGTAEGGLNGVIANFDLASIVGNNGGQNQSGLSATAGGTLQWTDAAGGAGAAISLGNGTAWNGNTFNNRTADLTGYKQMLVTMSATDAGAGGGAIFVQPFFQVNNFGTFHSLTGQNLPIDGLMHTIAFSVPSSLANMNVVDQTGLNLGSHTNQLTINVDLIRFVAAPEPGSLSLIGMALVAGAGAVRRRMARD